MNPIEQSIKRKIEAVGVPLKDWDIKINRGILTGCNEAFIIDEATRSELIAADPKSAEIIRPILRGRDIKRYGYNFAGLYLIAAHNGIPEKKIPRVDINEYPAIKRHLDSFWDKISKRTDMGDTPYNLRSCAYMEDFNYQRIAYREISNQMDACMLPSGIFISNKCYMISGRSQDLFLLLSFLNTRLFNKILLISANITGGKGPDFLENICVPKPENLPRKELELLQRSQDTNVDELCWMMIFGLTQQEQKYVMSM